MSVVLFLLLIILAQIGCILRKLSRDTARSDIQVVLLDANRVLAAMYPCSKSRSQEEGLPADVWTPYPHQCPSHRILHISHDSRGECHPYFDGFRRYIFACE